VKQILNEYRNTVFKDLIYSRNSENGKYMADPRFRLRSHVVEGRQLHLKLRNSETMANILLILDSDYDRT